MFVASYLLSVTRTQCFCQAHDVDSQEGDRSPALREAEPWVSDVVATVVEKLARCASNDEIKVWLRITHLLSSPLVHHFAALQGVH
jgi:hypothetical protein